MNISRDVALSDVLYYRIGGPVRALLDVHDANDLHDAIEFVERERPARLMVVGLGSNLLMPDDCFDGAVIRISAGAGDSILQLDGNTVEVFGGAILSDFAYLTLERGLTGLEWAGGLPGTVGAGVRGNVGAFGGEIEQRLRSADVILFEDGHTRSLHLQHADLDFAYRESWVKHQRNAIVASATFELLPGSEAEIDAAKAVHRRNIDYRQTRHPMEYPNCGSVFKNLAGEERVARVLAVWPDIEAKVRVDWHGKVSMGYIIGRLGLAGKRAGGAEISTKHHNFIVNLGNACSADVRALIRGIQERVFETFGLTPEVEIEIIE
ncbi:MAG TPA: UDP-N-acetylmuramate dehydrogenase [Nitrolancea sp.]|nr:UDP-N-acetylmuramate dehydrogenase [Nitrolancea sp.]